MADNATEPSADATDVMSDALDATATDTNVTTADDGAGKAGDPAAPASRPQDDLASDLLDAAGETDPDGVADAADDIKPADKDVVDADAGKVEVTQKTYDAALKLGLTEQELTAFDDEGQLESVVALMQKNADALADTKPDDTQDNAQDNKQTDAPAKRTPPESKLDWPEDKRKQDEEDDDPFPDKAHPAVRENLDKTHAFASENRDLIGAYAEELKAVQKFIGGLRDKQWTEDGDAFFAGLDESSQAQYGKGAYAKLPLTSQTRLNRNGIYDRASRILNHAMSTGKAMTPQQAFDEAQFGVSGSKTIKARAKAERTARTRSGAASMRHAPGDISDTPAERDAEDVAAILGNR